jgi:hypothetical protein
MSPSGGVGPGGVAEQPPDTDTAPTTSCEPPLPLPRASSPGRANALSPTARLSSLTVRRMDGDEGVHLPFKGAIAGGYRVGFRVGWRLLER